MNISAIDWWEFQLVLTRSLAARGLWMRGPFATATQHFHPTLEVNSSLKSGHIRSRMTQHVLHAPLYRTSCVTSRCDRMRICKLAAKVDRLTAAARWKRDTKLFFVTIRRKWVTNGSSDESKDVRATTRNWALNWRSTEKVKRRRWPGNCPMTTDDDWRRGP